MKTLTYNFKKKLSKCLLFFIVGIMLSSSSQTFAQTNVVIPDANFATWLNTNVPAAMSGGNLMNTTSTALTNLTTINVDGLLIANLSGIQYFSALQNLYCSNNQLTSLPPLPSSLTQLGCYYNQLTSLPTLPSSLTSLYCSNNQLTSLPALPGSLTDLECSANPLTSLPALPGSLTYLQCRNSQLTSLPALPGSLTYLDCFTNQLTSLPVLPGSLTYLDCSTNQLTSLPALPGSLIHLSCYYNQLTSLPALSGSLIYLACSNNQLTSLPALPSSLTELDCYANQITSLPALPGSLTVLLCGNNQLTSLPVLPVSLISLTCANNQLTSLPVLPVSLINLYCDNNQLISLPALPDSLATLLCQNNTIVCFPIFPNTIGSGYFNITPNPFSCLPNYIFAMDAGTLAYPLCVNGDIINNPQGCAGSQGIVGYTYKDNNANCIKDVADSSLRNIPLNLFDSNNNQVNQTYSAINGIYNFSDTAGTYTVKVDTTGMPFTAQCATGIDSTVTLTNTTALVTDVNFAITCKPGFDLGVQSVVSGGWVFPGQQHWVSIFAGDMSNWYNWHCSAGISGQVQVTVNGPVTYTGIALGALTPSVTGNMFTYSIADFGAINITDAFGLLFTTDTTAQVGDQICVNVSVTPTNGDNYTSNNNYQFCYQVINSYDPNMKEVYPVDVLPGYQDWFTYTIHFQNTGTAPAFNIRLLDTLSTNLDLETFQVINYSHHNTISLQNKVLSFFFQNIMLPDSTSDLEGSKGFVQYRIKPKASLPIGSVIHNTGYIYFDYNSAIITNTTENRFTATAAITEIMSMNEKITVYPNPFNDNTTFVIQSDILNEIYSFELFDVLGKSVKVKREISAKEFQISRDGLQNGVYFYKIKNSENNGGIGKLIIR